MLETKNAKRRMPKMWTVYRHKNVQNRGKSNQAFVVYLYNTMNHGQTHGIIDTPPKDRSCWPVLDDFLKREVNK